ncbi:hypothetical protein [Cellulomonas carbonis]|uniref:Uncharacterized protein n=1 Tax=Cellulomonas carbonis T26 TaxID=947969 RepID=A0A0A0BUD0_9CELL|nr:hypothetical protein [Cellulomonas carbonis]KGM11277.1 hypothetical protein N868_11235 [Cellulomonas carbonis T26]GGC18196.1 hypothetical protein GCM10010972_34280 [Cellulomonas carbonis]
MPSPQSPPSTRTSVTSSPLFRWHAPFAVVVAVLVAVAVGTGNGGLLWVAALLGAATLLSFLLMRAGTRMRGDADAVVAERFPGARFHAFVSADERYRPALGLPPGMTVAALLVVTDAGLHLLDDRTHAELVTLRWEDVLGAESVEERIGSTPLEAVDLALTGDRLVRLRTFDTRRVLGNDVILARPAHLPWPPSDAD